MRFSVNHILRVALLAILFIPVSVFAEGPPPTNEMNNPLAITLVAVIGGLLIAIGGLAYVVLSAAQIFVQQHKKEQSHNCGGGCKKVYMLLALCLAGTVLHAQEQPAATVVAAVDHFGGLSPVSFYALISVIGLELLVIMVLLYNLRVLLGKQEATFTTAAAPAPVKRFSLAEWWDKMNRFRALHEEADIELDHNYDGIRELDNRLPPWWLYGFYLTIFVAIVYLWRYHVSHSAPLSREEYIAAVEKADIEKAAYLAKAANNVDENTVKLLTDEASLEGGKKVFTTTCAACHGADGGGGVGPNLTDNYWLHGGGIKDVFKTIKYGWPEKGMKSWKDDFSPVQIAQIASYVKSLHGTHPATPKEAQGELYQETISAAPAQDSVIAASK